MAHVCRTCGQEAEHTRELFYKESTEILNNIETLTGIWLTWSPGVPSGICPSCLLELNKAIVFRERCINTNKLWVQEEDNQLDLSSAVDEKDDQGASTADVLDPVVMNTKTIKVESPISDTELEDSESQTHSKYNEEAVSLEAKPRGRLRNEEPIKKRQADQKKTSNENVTKKHASQTARVLDNKLDKFFCDQCGKAFSEKGNLNLHLKRHTGVKQFECEECGHKEFSNHLLNLHVRIKHRGELPYVCKFCGQRFGNCTLRLRHERKHNPRPRPQPRQYKCLVCDKGFTDKRSLKDHAVVHTDEQPFHCELCQTHFSRKKALITHLRSIRHRKKAEE